MKTTTTVFLSIALLLITGFTSCTKESADKIQEKSKTELLTQKAWKFVVQGLDENNNGVIEDSEADVFSCQLDDVFTFHLNGTGLHTIGSAKCYDDEVNNNFSWQFSNNETELAIFAYPEKINKLDENTLETYYDDQNSLGQPVKYIKRFIH